MSPWLVALGASLLITLVQYAWQRSHRGMLPWAAAELRFLAVLLIVALLMDAPVGRPRAVATWAALDVSQSMQRGSGAIWRAALDSAAAARPESTLWFGDSARMSGSKKAADDARSELRAAADRAVAAGHPV